MNFTCIPNIFFHSVQWKHVKHKISKDKKNWFFDLIMHFIFYFFVLFTSLCIKLMYVKILQLCGFKFTYYTIFIILHSFPVIPMNKFLIKTNSFCAGFSVVTMTYAYIKLRTLSLWLSPSIWSDLGNFFTNVLIFSQAVMKYNISLKIWFYVTGGWLR